MNVRQPERHIPTLETATELTGDTLTAALRMVIERGAAGFLPGRRWFGDKARAINGVNVLDLAVVAAGPDHFAPAIVHANFDDGGGESYFLPLVVTLEALPEEATLGVIEHGRDRWRVVEALSVPRFQEWLLARLAAPATVLMSAGALEFQPTSALSLYLAAAQTSGSRAVTGEQSNTSIIYGDAAILKAFRKLQPGVNPDIEIGAHLTEETSYRHVPPLLGSVHYQSNAGEPISIAVLQTFVPSTGDAWTLTVRELSEMVATAQAGVDAEDQIAVSVRWAAMLGQRTGELHVALSANASAPNFRPEPVLAEDIDGWRGGLSHAAASRREELSRMSGRHSDAVGGILSTPAVKDVAAGFEHLAGTAKIRVHGDYHLGQVLRTIDGDVMILDFEGEPSRPISERRLKTSGLKDVAGMLRSFSYARVAVLKSLDATKAADADRVLRAWEIAARAAFLRRYLAAVNDAATPLVPTGDAAFHQALAAWELDKALYEIHYELNNRPDWLDQVLQTLAEPSA